MKQIIGYLLLGLSLLSWVVSGVLVFSAAGLAKKSGMLAGIIVAGEICFALAVVLLGKQVWARINPRQYLDRFLPLRKPGSTPERVQPKPPVQPEPVDEKEA